MTPAPVRHASTIGPRSVTELADRVEAGRSARRSRGVRRFARALLLLTPVLGLAWVLLGSSWLAVDRVQVVGAVRLSAAEVERAVAVGSGTPLARVDTGAAERRVAALPPVLAVEISRSWPGTLRVEVTERTPVAGVVGAAGSAGAAGAAGAVGSAGVSAADGVQLIDAAGVLFGAERTLPAGLVALRVEAPGPQDPTTRAALQVNADLPVALRQRVRAITARSPSAVELVLDDGRQVVWGAPGGTATKAAAALVLLRTDSTVIDVSAPGVVVRRGGPSPSPSPQG